MQDRTEEATPKRQQEARSRGQTVRSTELTSVAGLLGVALLAQWWLPKLYEQLTVMMSVQFRTVARPEFTLESALTLGWDAGYLVLQLVWPVMTAALLLGVVASAGQSGVLLTLRPLMPDFDRLNPVSGLKRLFTMRTVMEGVKTVAKLSIGGYVAYRVLESYAGELVALVGSDVRGSSSVLMQAAGDLVIKAGAGIGVLAVADYFFQRWQHHRTLRMTRQEVREELRQSEGDPSIRSQIRRRQRQMATRRMMAAVPAADVVITNPTHFAVAIAYQPEKAGAPRVVAKGQLLLAQRIKALAQKSGVPIVENVALARALYSSVEVGREIPAALYQAVAEVLAFVYRLKRRR